LRLTGRGGREPELRYSSIGHLTGFVQEPKGVDVRNHLLLIDPKNALTPPVCFSGRFAGLWAASTEQENQCAQGKGERQKAKDKALYSTRFFHHFPSSKNNDCTGAPL
jgi:hypothetical protein